MANQTQRSNPQLFAYGFQQVLPRPGQRLWGVVR
jgi:hypothetical protein